MDTLIVENLSDEELVKFISPSSPAYIELKKRNVLRTKNIVGEIGEYFIIKFYNNNSKLPKLSLAPTGTRNVNALSKNGETYSIKTITSRTGTTGSFWDPSSIRENNKKFDFLIIVVLDECFSLDLILQLTWEDFFKYKKFNKRMNNFNISLTKTLINSVQIIFDKENE